MADRTLLATTRCGGVKVYIYSVSDRVEMKGIDGCTHWKRGRMEVYLAPRLLLKGKEDRLAKVILHEFVHVIEYVNDPAYLSSATVDDCTELAQAMEEGLGDLYKHLRGPGATLLSRPLAVKPKRRRGRK